MAQVHRFGDGVAAYLGNGGETAYLTPTAARQIATALLAVAEEVESCRFARSTVGTFAIVLEDGRNPTDYKNPRDSK